MKRSSLLIIICLLLFIKNGLCASEGEFIRLVKEYTYNPDGSVEFNYDKELKINTHLAFNSLYGETFIVYNPDFQIVKINKAYTIQADGNKIELPQNAVNEVLPFQAANAPAYNHLKEMVITHTGLEIGATIYLNYSILTKPGYYPGVYIDEILQESSPIKYCSLIVNIPNDLNLNYTLSGGLGKPVVKESSEGKQYSWTFKNITAACREPYQSAEKKYAPRVVANSSGNQEAALKIFQKQLNSVKLNDPEIGPVKELVKDKATKKEKALALQDYVVNMIATIPLSFENCSLQNRAPSDVFLSSYGTPAEKNMLLAAMLKVVDIKPEILVIYPGYLKKAIQGTKPIKELKLKVDTDNAPLFLSAHKKTTASLELQGNRNDVWIVSENKIAPLLVIGNSAEISYNANISLNPSGVRIEGFLQLGNGIIPELTENGLKSYLKEAAGLSATNSDVNSIVSDKKSCRINFTDNKKCEETEGYLIYTLPETGKGFKSWHIDHLNSERKSDLEIPFSIKEVYDYHIVVQDGLSMKSKEYDIVMEKPAGKVKISIKNEGGKINVHRELILDKVIITPAEYSGFRELVNAWLDPLMQNLVFSTK